MPRTVIVRQTWRCSNCDSEWDSAVLDGQTCSHCKAGVVQIETDPARCGTLTVMGEEDIEPEVEERNETTFRARRLAEIDVEIATRDAQGEFPTTIAREHRRASRQAEVEQRIAGLKRDAGSVTTDPTFRPRGFFLGSAADRDAYRVKRRQDIAAAIMKAREREHKP